ncbi:hypothetical protein [Helicobacter jaachi]|nr:hypothetical protein [Helicobacter jaachi]
MSVFLHNVKVIESRKQNRADSINFIESKPTSTLRSRYSFALLM